MITMADIFKKANEENKEDLSLKKENPPPASEEKKAAAPSEPAPASVFRKSVRQSDSESKQLYQDIAGMVKELAGKDWGSESAAEDVKKLIDLIEKIADQLLLENEHVFAFITSCGRDLNVFSHPINAGIISIELGIGYKYEKPKLIKLGAAAVLHDIGIIRSSKLYNQTRPGKVDECVKAINQSWSVAEILESISYLNSESAVVRVIELDKDTIDEYASIIILAEVYEIMINSPGQMGVITPSEALKEIINNKKLFKYRLVKNFIDRIGPFPVGSYVKLSSGEIVRVVKCKLGFPFRPTVEVIHPAEGEKSQETKLISLSDHPTICIKKYLKESEI